MEEIIEKTETHQKTIIGDVFKTQWNIKAEEFCKNSCLHLMLTIFAAYFILLVLQGYEYSLIKLNRTAISANLFLNYILSSHYYLAVRHWSQIKHKCLSFQIDSPLYLNTYNISQPLFTDSKLSERLKNWKEITHYCSINMMVMSLSTVSRC